MTRYCICRSKNGTGFMIQCDRCLEWFHGKCISLNKKSSKYIEKYFCQACRDSVHGLKIQYLAGFEPVLSSEGPEKPSKTHGSGEPSIEGEKPEKKVLEKIQATASKTPTQTLTSPSKLQSGRRRVNQKSKSKSSHRKQCANPECTYECRSDSKYCSDECGIALNKLRYQLYFIPRWRELEENHSVAKSMKRTEIEKLYNEKEELFKLIRTLKEEKEELDKNIKLIKEQATKRAKENINIKKEDDEDDEDSCDTGEEALTGDANKSFCVTCGLTLLNQQTLKHWAACHKKHEAAYNFSADAVFQHSCKEDENPKLYCNYQDKKTKRYCMHLESACPQHSNWLSDKDEVCGCPTNIMQRLDPDKCGGFCLELKKECQQHYHWDKFRLAQLNMQRIQAFTRLDVIQDRIRVAEINYDDTYGGVVGVMLHKTTDHKPKTEPEVDIDVEMTNS